MCRGAKLIAVLGSACTVAACAVAPPSGPTVMALPSQGKDLAAFQQEDGQCRNYAAVTIGDLRPGQAATQTTVGSAAVGTAVGAAAGAAIGAAAGNAGAGAAIGGATGLVGGTAVGANNAAAREYDLQARYKSLTRSVCTPAAILCSICRPAATAIMIMGLRAILGTIGRVQASSAVASLYSTEITNSIVASMMASTGAPMGHSTRSSTGTGGSTGLPWQRVSIRRSRRLFRVAPEGRVPRPRRPGGSYVSGVTRQRGAA